MATAPDSIGLTLPRRLWRYQKERFPVFQNGLLIVAFATSAVCISALLRGQTSLPTAGIFVTAFLVLSGLFLQLRIADEFKDAEVDARYRPERAVPRGLVTLRELAGLGLLVMVLLAAVTLFRSVGLFLLLLLVWGYMGLMTVEFFVPDWLRSHLFLYMFSHMLIMPLIDLLATACDWLVITGTPPAGLPWFLAVSFFNGMILELGRKTWAPDMEREGVESYSSDWGVPKAVAVWGVAVAGSFGCAVIVSIDIGFVIPTVAWLGGMALISLSVAFAFKRQPTEKRARRLELLSGLWVLCVYLVLGVVPMGAAQWP